MRVPIATYRLQINEEFKLDDARAIVPYLAELGISDLYLSPVFEARPGSRHGYDVTDPTRIRDAVGGLDALRSLAGAAQQHGMGILLDIVPNHMAASPLNPWWRDMLMHGRESQYAAFFDVDWGPADAPRRIRLPILGDQPDALIDRGDITLDTAAEELVYFDNRLPLAPGSLAGSDEPGDAETVRRVLERQHYELAFWRSASEAMNYRRFFDITDLAGVRVEDERVFEATHALVRTLAQEGVITGLRIDHIDGLRDPTGYLDRLRAWVRGPDGEPVYTIVEKILERDEQLPPQWECEGTTGYEFTNLATGLLIQPEGYRQLEEFYVRLTGDTLRFGDLVREKKLLVMGRLFGSELSALGCGLARLTALDEHTARAAVAEITASMSVYRTYIRDAAVRDEDRERIDAAASDASSRNSDLHDALRQLRELLLHPAADAERLDWVLRWQQFSGPVMAKGFEDTALYCHNVLLAANEVGSDPVRPAIAAQQLHETLALRAAAWAGSLNATATHDTKRGEDTRARIAVLSEVAEEWRAQLRRWIRQGDEWKTELAEDEDTSVPGADVDSLLYQTLIGAWPIDGSDDVFVERIKEYMTKAVREAKEQTSWRRPDEDYEQALAAFIEVLMQEVGRVGLAESIGDFAARLAPHGVLNSIVQLLLKIAAPGIPDTYQGTELWSFTLVDPDNRREVDYEQRRSILSAVSGLLDSPTAAGMRQRMEQWRDGSIKLLVTSLALRCRRRHADVFTSGGVTPLHTHGARAAHVVAFARSYRDRACMLVLPRWTTRLAPGGVLPTGRDVWEDTRLPLPPVLRGTWRNALTDERIRAAEDIDVATLFASVPFALLEPA